MDAVLENGPGIDLRGDEPTGEREHALGERGAGRRLQDARQSVVEGLERAELRAREIAEQLARIEEERVEAHRIQVGDGGNRGDGGEEAGNIETLVGKSDETGSDARASFGPEARELRNAIEREEWIAAFPHDREGEREDRVANPALAWSALERCRHSVFQDAMRTRGSGGDRDGELRELRERLRKTRRIIAPRFGQCREADRDRPRRSDAVGRHLCDGVAQRAREHREPRALVSANRDERGERVLQSLRRLDSRVRKARSEPDCFLRDPRLSGGGMKCRGDPLQRGRWIMRRRLERADQLLEQINEFRKRRGVLLRGRRERAKPVREREPGANFERGESLGETRDSLERGRGIANPLRDRWPVFEQLFGFDAARLEPRREGVNRLFHASDAIRPSEAARPATFRPAPGTRSRPRSRRDACAPTARG